MDDGSIPVVRRKFTRADTTAAIGDITHCIHIAITCPLCRIIHTLGFIGPGIITVTHPITAIIGATILMRTSIDAITVEVGMSLSHSELTIDVICDLKTGVLGVHAV